MDKVSLNPFKEGGYLYLQEQIRISVRDVEILAEVPGWGLKTYIHIIHIKVIFVVGSECLSESTRIIKKTTTLFPCLWFWFSQ
jgi:hypothetical protein